jgi:ABC-type uncharacterized transport system permease subunit
MTIKNIHLVFVAISILAAVLSMLFSALYLVQQWRLKKQKDQTGIRLPSLERLDRLVVYSMITGAVSLSVLLVTGVFLAHVVWKDMEILNNWTKESKFIIPTITWFWLVLILFMRFRLGMRGEKFFYSSLVGLLLLTITCLISMVI